jgi:hypothetical protein
MAYRVRFDDSMEVECDSAAEACALVDAMLGRTFTLHAPAVTSPLPVPVPLAPEPQVASPAAPLPPIDHRREPERMRLRKPRESPTEDAKPKIPSPGSKARVCFEWLADHGKPAMPYLIRQAVGDDYAGSVTMMLTGYEGRATERGPDGWRALPAAIALLQRQRAALSSDDDEDEEPTAETDEAPVDEASEVEEPSELDEEPGDEDSWAEGDEEEVPTVPQKPKSYPLSRLEQVQELVYRQLLDTQPQTARQLANTIGCDLDLVHAAMEAATDKDWFDATIQGFCISKKKAV